MGFCTVTVDSEAHRFTSEAPRYCTETRDLLSQVKVRAGEMEIYPVNVSACFRSLQTVLRINNCIQARPDPQIFALM